MIRKIKIIRNGIEAKELQDVIINMLSYGDTMTGIHYFNANKVNSEVIIDSKDGADILVWGAPIIVVDTYIDYCLSFMKGKSYQVEKECRIIISYND